MRLMEGLRLRMKDAEFERQDKDGKDRVVMLPQSLREGLRTQLRRPGRCGSSIGPLDRLLAN